MRIFVHNFVADKAKIRRRAAARQEFLTQYASKFAEKTCAYAYEDRFLLIFYTKQHLKFRKNQADSLEYMLFRRRFFPLFFGVWY